MPVYDSSLSFWQIKSIYSNLSQQPASVFTRPLCYRVVHASSPVQDSGCLRSRLYPPPALEELNIGRLTEFVKSHAYLTNRLQTPFISVTPDLIRAFQIAFYMYQDKADVTILVIDPGLLNEGSSLPCNEIRSKCGIGRKDIYNTEVLVWGEIPAESIVCRWRREDIIQSGLLDACPSLDQLHPTMTLDGRLHSTMKLDELRRHIAANFDKFTAVTVANALVSLGMDPSSVYTKQIFLFLLGQAAGYAVQKEYGDVERPLREIFRSHIEEFEQSAYKTACMLGKERLLAYFKHNYSHDIRGHYHSELGTCLSKDREWRLRWARHMKTTLCPSYEAWWVQREKELHIQAAWVESTDGGLRSWLNERSNRVTYIGFVSENCVA